jgi:hypothetical protein
VTLSGFWSYVHADDDAEGGRIAQLGRDLATEFELLTSESVDLFLDRDSLEWGAEWRTRIETSLANIAFFVPVLTPRYFASPACRTELQSFARRAEQFRVRTLLLPVLYIDLPFEDSEDELVELARSFQWVDWRELRFAERADGVYRRTVHELAQRLVAANREADSTDASTVMLEAATEMDPPGMLDVLATYEASLPALVATTNEIADQIAAIGVAAASLSPQLDAVPPGNTPFAWRLRVLRDLSAALAPHAENLDRLGATFASDLHDMDAGVRTIITTAPTQPANRVQFCSFFNQVRSLSEAAASGLTPLESMLESASGLEELSREIRPVIREMRQGVVLLLEGRQVMATWVSLIDELGWDCGSRGEQPHDPRMTNATP